MAENPDYVLIFPRQKNTEFKKIGNNWYVYERFSKYDPTTKRSRKVSGKCLGKITPEGFVQTKRRLTPEADQSSPSVRRVSDVAEAGAVMFYWNRAAAMRERL